MHDDTCYETPFLKEVIARIDFVAPIDVFEKTLPPKLAKTISQHFPISEPRDAIAQEFQIGADELHHRKTQFKEWNFYGKDREKRFALAASWVFVTYKKYTSYEEMKDTFSTLIKAIEKVSPDARAARFGLRFINHIEIKDITSVTGWNEYIAAGLLETTAFFADLNRLARLFHLAELKYEEVDMKFQFGLPNPDYPAVMKRQMFMLDFDAYVQSAHDLSESLKYMDTAHELIQDLFEKSITDKLRAHMNANPTDPL